MASAEEWKNTGNQEYTAKRYREAVDAYSQAIAIEPTNCVYYTNRASAHIMLQNHREVYRNIYSLFLNEINVKFALLLQIGNCRL